MYLASRPRRPDNPHNLSMARSFKQKIDRITICQSCQLGCIQMFLGKLSFCFTYERFSSFNERCNTDVEELILEGDFQVGDGGKEAVVGQGHVVLHVHHFLLVNVDLE